MNLQIKIYRKKYIFLSFLPITKDRILYLHCVDSRLEENGSWFSRFHIGPFYRGSRLQVGTRLRRSLLNDLAQTSIIAVKLDGAQHEFSRLSGIHESTLDVLFQFRKIAINAPFMQMGETIVIPFFFHGPGIFYSKDIPWPNKIKCRNPIIYLVSLSPGSVIRGRILIKKNLNLNLNYKNLLNFGKTLPFEHTTTLKKQSLRNKFPWIRLGYPIRRIKRVGFRIESLEPLNRQNEILIIEIVTNGRLSPRIALREASLRLTHKFSSLASLILPLLQKNKYISKNNKHIFQIYSDKKFNEKFKKVLKLKRKNISNLPRGSSYLSNPFTLDLGNLDLSRERYSELQNFGLTSVDQLLERLAFESYCFSPLLKKQRQESLFYLGFFSFLKNMKNKIFFAKVVGRRKKAVANLELIPGSGKIQINGRIAEQFFSGNPKRLLVIQKPFFISTYLKFNVKVKVKGGGLQSQADSIKLALARALVKAEPKIRSIFRESYLLTRDYRKKERRKYGLKKARKAPQFSKR